MKHDIGGAVSILTGAHQMVVMARAGKERVESTFNSVPLYADPHDTTNDVIDRWYVEGAKRARERADPAWIYNMRPNIALTRTEWAELWPDGRILPAHRNATPIGTPDKPPPNAHHGTVWVRRAVRYSPWERHEL